MSAVIVRSCLTRTCKSNNRLAILGIRRSKDAIVSSSSSRCLMGAATATRYPETSSSVSSLSVVTSSSLIHLHPNQPLSAACLFSTSSSSGQDKSHLGNRNAAASASFPSDDEDKSDDMKKEKSASKSSSVVGAYSDLAKGRLSALVCTTTLAGFVAAGGPISSQLDVLAACLTGTALCSSSAAAWNQIVEIEQDKRMKRTQQRPLVLGTLTPSQAITAASVWGVAGGSILYVGTDPTTAALGVGNLFLYSGLYTYMKQKSVYNTWVGALVGAIPPVMGWSAATGGSILELEAVLLGATLYLWQMPHFFALSYMHRIDYKRGGFHMVPCMEQDGEETSKLIVKYAWLLSSIPFVATATGVTSSMFAIEGIALNAYALKVAHDFSNDRSNAKARKVFLTSLWYLPCLLMLYLLHSKVWDEGKDESEDDKIHQFLSHYVHATLEKGRGLCVHETAVARTTHGEEKCPLTVGSKMSQQGVDAAVATAHVAAEAAESAMVTSAATMTIPVENSSTSTQEED